MYKLPIIAATVTGALMLSVPMASADLHPFLPPPPAPETNHFPDSRIADSLRPGNPSLRPGNAADRISNTGIDRSIDRLLDLPTGAGMRTTRPSKEPVAPAHGLFSNPSFFMEYNYINTDDSRRRGSDSETHSAQIGGDVIFADKIVLGLIYSYSATDGDSAFLRSTSDSDAHFVSAYAATTIWQIVNVGITGGYGHTGTDSRLRGAPDRTFSSDTDSWTVSPFLGVSHKWGALSGSLTAAYSYQTNDYEAPAVGGNDNTGKFTLTGRVGYAVTERLKVEGSARLNQYVHGSGNTPGFSEDHTWATFGAKVSYNFTREFQLYGGYEYDAWNSNYETHTAKGGINYAF